MNERSTGTGMVARVIMDNLRIAIKVGDSPRTAGKLNYDNEDLSEYWKYY